MAFHTKRESNGQLLPPFVENAKHNIELPVDHAVRPDGNSHATQQSQFWVRQVDSTIQPVAQTVVNQQWQPQLPLQAASGVRPYNNTQTTHQCQPRQAHHSESAFRPNINTLNTQQSEHALAMQIGSAIRPPFIHPYIAEGRQPQPALQAQSAIKPNTNPLGTQQLQLGLATPISSPTRPPFINPFVAQQWQHQLTPQADSASRTGPNSVNTQQPGHGQAIKLNSVIRPPVINPVFTQQWQGNPGFQVGSTTRPDINLLNSPQLQYGLARQAHGAFRPDLHPAIRQQAPHGPALQVPGVIQPNMKPLITLHSRYRGARPVDSAVRSGFNFFNNVQQPQHNPTLLVQTSLEDAPLASTVHDIIRYCDVDINEELLMQEEFMPDEGPSTEETLQRCTSCPDWSWLNAKLGKLCAQCEVNRYERYWKLRKVLQMTAVYKNWISILSDSSLDLVRRGEYLLQCNRRLRWLQERQEYIRVETERVIKEVEVDHDPDDCSCQGVSGWAHLSHPSA